MSEPQLNACQTGAVKEERKPEEKTTEDGIWKFWEIERPPEEKFFRLVKRKDRLRDFALKLESRTRRERKCRIMMAPSGKDDT
jgi:hypothetical protein